MKMINLIRQALKPKYPTLNRIEVSSEALKSNLSYLQSFQPGAEIIPVLKSNAYGHGLKEVCRILRHSSVKMVAVDSFPEAQTACRYFNGKVLVLGEMPLAAYRHLNWKRTEICIYNSATLAALAATGKKAKIHLFVNTGMNREGIKDLPSFWKANTAVLGKMEISGLCSHLADAEGDGSLNSRQLSRFFQDLDFLHQQGVNPHYVHLGNSAGIFSIHDPRLTAFRPGLAIYGYNPFSPGNPYYEAGSRLRPALRLLSTIVSVQELMPGEIVSYNGAYEADKATKVVVIPFGYYEGLDRRLSNLADFQLYKGTQVFSLKLAGKVCMNLCCLDAGREAPVAVGDEVVLISDRRSDFNSLENLSTLQGSIPYEALVKLQANIRRRII
ncbi:MAG: alanine racemase [Bacillota bacterium]